MSKDKFIKYGGAKFTTNAPAETINKFVRELPTEAKSSLFEVTNELEEAGLIDVDDSQLTTIDPVPPDKC